MFTRPIYAAFCLALLLSTTACLKGIGLDEQDRLFDEINKTEGPQVEGVEASLLKSAKDAVERGNIKNAGSLYQQLVSIDDKNTDYLLGLADALRRDGQTDSAEKVYLKIPKDSPDYMDAQEGIALVALYKGDFDKAGKKLSQILTKDEKRWRTLNGLGILLVERGTYDDAIAYFERSLKYSNNNPSVLNNIGLTHAINNEPKAATRYLLQAAEATLPKSPRRKNIDMNLALVMGIFGDEKAAKKILSEHLDEASISNNLGLYAYLANNDELAKSYLNTALSRSPYHYKRAWENLSAITKQGRITQGSAKSVKVK